MDLAKIRKKIKEAGQMSQEGPGQPKIKQQPEENEPIAPQETLEEKPEKTRQKPLQGHMEEKPEETMEEAPVSEVPPKGTKEQTIVEEERALPAPEETKTAQPRPFEEKEEVIAEFLTFKLGKEFYAFRIDEIAEILRPQKITSVPRVDPFIMGVTSLRGKIIPVIDLKKRLLLGNGSYEAANEKVLILNGPKGSVGALVDKVIDVVRFNENDIVEPPGHLSEAELKFIRGVTVYGDMFLSIISLDEVLNFKMAAEV